MLESVSAEELLEDFTLLKKMSDGLPESYWMVPVMVRDDLHEKLKIISNEIADKVDADFRVIIAATLLHLVSEYKSNPEKFVETIKSLLDPELQCNKEM